MGAVDRGDAAALAAAVVVVAFTLVGRGAWEPRVGEGVPVEVVGAVVSPGVALAWPTVRDAIRAAGGVEGVDPGFANDATPLEPGSRVEVRRDGVRVLGASDPLLLGEVVDLNQASGRALLRVPGFGPATATRVIDLRARVDGLRAVDELAWVRGLGPAQIAAVAPLVTVGEVAPRPPWRPLDLNRATARQLEGLPGIGPARAAAIVADRNARGAFPSVQALARVRGIGPGTVARLDGAVQAGP